MPLHRLLAITATASLCACDPGLTAAQAAAKQAACAFKPGMMSSQTVPASMPTGKDIPIDHIILIMQENRSFDHYFSSLTVPGQTVDGASPTITNPDSNGDPVSRFHFTTKCMSGGDHGWDPEHANLDGGKLDGFVKTNSSNVPMGYYDGGDLPYYYALARTFASSDRHFCSVLGPTWPNRMFYFAATSFGRTGNNFPPTMDPQGHPYPNLFSELDAARVTWHAYAQDLPTPWILPSVADDVNNFTVTSTFQDCDKSQLGSCAEQVFAADVAKGNLASVTVVEGSDLLGADSPDEGPPGDVDIGQQFVGNVASTIMHSPFWATTAIFVTYDENGGMYDHVLPPAACAPDEIPPDNHGTVGFTQYGFRVPFLVISPYAKRGYVSHVVTDHTAILRFVEARFGLPAMTGRDANAEPPYDMFDFAHPDLSIPDLPATPIDVPALQACGG